MNGSASEADRPLRWYRGGALIWLNSGILATFLAVIAALLLYQGLTDARDRLEIGVGGLAAVAAAWALIGGLRSGIGAGASGVTVRSAWGRRTKVPWPEVVGFQPMRPNNWRGGLAVAVVRRDRPPLVTTGCAFHQWRRRSGWARLNQVLQALEAEQAAVGATHSGLGAQEMTHSG